MGAVIDIAVACIRAGVFVASIQAAGAALFLLLFQGHLATIDRRLRRLIAWSAAVAASMIVLRAALEPARMAGELSGILDPFLRSLFWNSDVSVAQLVRLAGITLLLGAAGSRQAWTGVVWALAIALVIASFTLMGHTRGGEGGVALGSLLAVHLAAVVFWSGSLLPLSLLLKHGARDAVIGAVGDFSRLAVWFVPVLLAAGITIAWILLGSLEALTTPYGVLLLSKLAGFMALLVLAAVNRFRLTPAIAGGAPSAVSVMRRSIALELGIMVLVLFATAFMTTLYSPS